MTKPEPLKGKIHTLPPVSVLVKYVKSACINLKIELGEEVD